MNTVASNWWKNILLLDFLWFYVHDVMKYFLIALYHWFEAFKSGLNYMFPMY